MPSIPTIFGFDGGIARSHPTPSHDTTTTLRSSGLGNAASVDASLILKQEQRHTIQVLAACTSSISITAVACAVYWFFMMRRNFRRDLVLLLILGDFWKSLWFLTFSAYTFVNGPVASDTYFCQGSGYLLQVGFEACDLSIFFMSLHMWLQIFPPSHSILGHDGLYRIRKWVYALWFILPNLNAALAFVNSSGGYEAAGAFCSLPIRPYWYRLALSWIPRYLIWIFITAAAIRIYKHVGKEFKVFANEYDDTSSMEMPGDSSIQATAAMETLATQRPRSSSHARHDLEKQEITEDGLAPDEISAQRTRHLTSQHNTPPQTLLRSDSTSRGPSAPNWSSAFAFPVDSLPGAGTPRSGQDSRRGSRQIADGVISEDFAPANNNDSSAHRPSVTTLTSVHSSAAQADPNNPPTLAPIREILQRGSASTSSSTPAQTTAAQMMKARRRAIQRQMRLLFIYPVVYMIFWTIPFAAHAMNYNQHFAQHPVFALTALNIFCLSLLSAVDVAIFSWREKPWRHIPGSDGTFRGSFAFWRFCRRKEWVDARRESRASPNTKEKAATSSQSGLLANLKRWSMSFVSSPSSPPETPATAPARPPIVHRRMHSGGSERKQMAADRAHERLALERADWELHRRSLEGRRASVVDVEAQPLPPPPMPEQKRSREWWDRQMSVDLFNDKHDEV